MSELQIANRRDELVREAEKAANAILRSATVNVHSVRYNVDVERNQIELFVVVDSSAAAGTFERQTQLPVNQSAADQPGMRVDREHHARAILGTARQNPHRFDIRLVSFWTGPIEGIVRPNLKNRPATRSKSAGKRPALRR